MAKVHIRQLARELVDKYALSEEVLSESALSIQHVMMGPDEQQEFSKYKGKVDANLSFLSVALSAAAKGRVGEIIATTRSELQSFNEPLAQLIDNLSTNEMTSEQVAQSQMLVSMYTDKIKSLESSLRILNIIYYWQNFPNKKKKQLAKLIQYDSAVPLMDRLAQEYKQRSIFTDFELSLREFKSYIETLFAPLQASNPEDDLNE